MRKILTIAAREYKAMVGTKAFLLSIIMMPVLMLGSIVVMELLRNSGDIKDRKIAIIDARIDHRIPAYFERVVFALARNHRPGYG